MIYSKFGSPLTLLSRQQDNNGLLSIQATAEGTTDIREYHVGDLKADEGMPEIERAIAKLPVKVVAKKIRRDL